MINPVQIPIGDDVRSGQLKRLAPVLLLVLGLAACATDQGAPRARPRAGMEGAVTQPLQDLSLVRDRLPPVLIEAAISPYALPAGLSCQVAAATIAQLDAVLGPDLDEDPVKAVSVVSSFALDAVRGAIALPFRGIVRRMSGAEERERQRVRAVLAGMVRRGFLKGWSRAQGCPPPPSPST
jgi:hypothetical protein